MKAPPTLIKHLGLQDYTATWRAMQSFTDNRQPDSADEIWFLQHPPVFTQGTNGDPAHILSAGDIPVIQIDRGGQVTYHGPGQLVVYPLIDLVRLKIGIRSLVTALESAIIDTLADFSLIATTRHQAPGVYVENAKIASIGLRIRHHCSYHGLAINVDMDLSPFNRINPCGFKHMAMTQIKTLNPDVQFDKVAHQLEHHLRAQLKLS